MKRLNIVIWNFEYKIERRKRCDAKIDGLRNKAGHSGNIVRRRERCVNSDDDDNFFGMSDGNYDSVLLSYGDQFGKPRNHRYGGAMREIVLPRR
jgi:hypothetical protein